MLLTKIRDGESAARPRLRRLSGATLPTMDRRAFLKRSGLVAGAGAFASQLPYHLIGNADAACTAAYSLVSIAGVIGSYTTADPGRSGSSSRYHAISER